MDNQKVKEKIVSEIISAIEHNRKRQRGGEISTLYRVFKEGCQRRLRLS